MGKYHNKSNRVLVFVLYKKEAPRVERLLSSKGYKVGAVHGDMSQYDRTQVGGDFSKLSTVGKGNDDIRPERAYCVVCMDCRACKWVSELERDADASLAVHPACAFSPHGGRLAWYHIRYMRASHAYAWHAVVFYA